MLFLRSALSNSLISRSLISERAMGPRPGGWKNLERRVSVRQCLRG